MKLQSCHSPKTSSLGIKRTVSRLVYVKLILIYEKPNKQTNTKNTENEPINRTQYLDNNNKQQQKKLIKENAITSKKPSYTNTNPNWLGFCSLGVQVVPVLSSLLAVREKEVGVSVRGEGQNTVHLEDIRARLHRYSPR